MPLPVIGSGVRVAFNWLPPTGLRRATNVMHFINTLYDLNDVWTDLQANVTANMWLGVRSTARIETVVLTPLDGGGVSAVKTAPVTAAWQGGSGAGDIVPQVSVLIGASTAKRGRSYRGRIYLPYISESAIAGGVYDATSQAAQTTAWNAFRTGMTSAGSAPGVASYKLATIDAITGYSTRGFTATQRRRQQR